MSTAAKGLLVKPEAAVRQITADEDARRQRIEEQQRTEAARELREERPAYTAGPATDQGDGASPGACRCWRRNLTHW